MVAWMVTAVPDGFLLDCCGIVGVLPYGGGLPGSV